MSGKDTELQMLQGQKSGKLSLRQTYLTSQFGQMASPVPQLCNRSGFALPNLSTIPSEEKFSVCSGFFPE